MSKAMSTARDRVLSKMTAVHKKLGFGIRRGYDYVSVFHIRTFRHCLTPEQLISTTRYDTYYITILSFICLHLLTRSGALATGL